MRNLPTLEGLVWNGYPLGQECGYGLVIATKNVTYLANARYLVPIQSGGINCIIGNPGNKHEIYFGRMNKICRTRIISEFEEPEEPKAYDIDDVKNRNLEFSVIGRRQGNVTGLCIIDNNLFDAGQYSHIHTTNLIAKEPDKNAAKFQEVCPGATKLAQNDEFMIGLVPQEALQFIISLSTWEYEAHQSPRIVDFEMHDNKTYLATADPGPAPGQPVNQPTTISIMPADKQDILARRTGTRAILQSAGENKKMLFDAVGNKIYNTLEDPEGKKPIWTLESDITCMTTLPLASWWAFYEAVNK